MRLNNFLIKVQNKINIFFQKHFGRVPGFKLIILALAAMLISSEFYYYISDLGINVFLAFVVTTAVAFLLLFLIYIILRHILVVFRRIKTKNLAIYLIFIAVLYKIYDEALYTIELDKKNIYLGLFIFLIIAVMFAKSLISFSKNKKKSALIFLIPSAVVIAATVYFLFMPGFDNKVIHDLDVDKNKIATRREKYEVAVVDYQGGDCNLTKYASYSGTKKKIRDYYFKRGLNEAKITGRAYLPKGKDNAQVLFIAHGNHRFTTENYLGYDYLGEYLAKRGFAVISVDMNILNGFYKVGLSNENDARAVLLLENISYILDQNNIKKSSFYKKIDKNNIALLGHSRGGEACAIAYNYNELTKLPEDGNKALNYGFNIKGVIEIAPTYDQYSPGGKYLTLNDTNFLTIAGTNDADVSTFEGMNMYDNVLFKENSDKFKAAVYIGYANHGQFNSRWNDLDSDPFKGWLLNREELLKESDQQKIISIYVNEFLENIFEVTYNRELFKNGPDEYKDLPKTNYYSRYENGSTDYIANFEEDYSLTTASVESARISYEDLYKIMEKNHKYGEGSSNTSAVFIGSNKGGSYKIHLNSEGEKNLGSALTFDIENLADRDISDNIIIKVQDSWGNSSSLKVSDYKKLTPPTKSYIFKADYLTKDSLRRQTPQTVTIPMNDFRNKNADVNLDDLNLIEFKFEDGVDISLDNIGFRK